MFRILVMNGILISLISVWISAAKDTSGGPSSAEFPTKLRSYAQSEPRVSLDVTPLDARRRRNTCRRELKGKCVRRNRRCPHSLPSEKSPGKPYCSRRKRCCYLEDTFCKFNSTQERNEFLRLWPGRCPGEEDGDCALDLEQDRPAYPPLILNPANKVVHEKSVRISTGSTLTFVCSNTNFILNNEPIIKLVCEDGKLLYGNDELEWTRLGCISQILPTVIEKNPTRKREVEIGCNINNGESLWQIGFELHQEDNPFFPMVELCFEMGTKTTRWTEHIIYGTVPLPWFRLPNAPNWRPAGMFPGIQMNNIYNVHTQSHYFNEILGGNIFGVNRYFNRGHLSPKMDFITMAEKSGTYYYSNALPQWIAFNGGNWESIETSVKNLALDRTVDLQIHTGGSGVLQLQDNNGQDINIYIADSQNDIENQVPVPALFWKIVYDESTDTAVAFITTNDPVSDDPPDFPFDSSCNLLSWIPLRIRIQLETQELGYSYCCTINQFRRIFPDMEVDVDGEPGLLV